MDFTGQTAVVTGASRGIGRAVAFYFWEKGANVVLAVRSPQGLKLPKVLKNSPRVLVVKTNVLATMDLEKMVKKSLNRFGKIDILVNNAGVDQPRSLLEVTEKHIDYVMNTNFKSVVFCSKLVAKEMIKQKKGIIINLSSIAGKEGSLNHLAYVSSKHAVIGLTKCLARELIGYNIRVNCVCPGLIDTDMLRNFFKEYSRQVHSTPRKEIHKMLAQTPTGRMGQPEDVAKLIGFLASDESRNITGQAINTDGGMQQH